MSVTAPGTDAPATVGSAEPLNRMSAGETLPWTRRRRWAASSASPTTVTMRTARSMPMPSGWRRISRAASEAGTGATATQARPSAMPCPVMRAIPGCAIAEAFWIASRNQLPNAGVIEAARSTTVSSTRSAGAPG